VLPKDKPVRHLALVDNVDAGKPIVAEAQKQQETRLEQIAAGEPVAPAPAPRRRRERIDRNGPVKTTYRPYHGRVNPVAMNAARLIQARHGGYLQKVNATTVIVRNHPLEKTNEAPSPDPPVQ
jgi:hypothetical protein